jgi:signal transduction histidine kinase
MVTTTGAYAVAAMADRTRWLTILVPVALIGTIELLSDTLLDEVLPFPADTILVSGVVLVIAAVVSTLTFRRIDRLSSAIRERNAELETRNASARALHHVSVAITALADLDRILDAIVDSARQILATDVALLLLVGTRGDLRLAASSGPTDEIRPAGDLPGTEIFQFVPPELGVGRLVAPLQRGGDTIGLLAVGARTVRSFGVDDVETLSSLANQAAIAIENASLQRELRDVAVRDERERIARELHDGLAQVLGYVNTKSQAVEELLAGGRIGDARAQLEQLAAAARSLYVDVRETILGLRGPIPAEHGLIEALSGYAGRFAEASKLAVVFEVSDAARSARPSAEVEAQIFRIVQEALTNIRKHAAARRVTVQLDVADGRLVVDVADDGRGFDGTSPSADWPHYGLITMRERAEAVAGTIAWSSRPGEGTRLRVTAPIEVGEPVGSA